MSLFLKLNFNKIELQVKLDINNVELYLKIYTKLNFEDIEFYTKLDFVKIEFKKRKILLNSFKTGTFYCIILKLGINANFAHILIAYNNNLHFKARCYSIHNK